MYDNCELLITVLGGIKITGLDRLRVTLKVEHKTRPLLPVRHNLDLYNQPHTEQLVNKIAENFEISTQATTHTLAALTSELESYRVRRLESLAPEDGGSRTRGRRFSSCCRMPEEAPRHRWGWAPG